jgi:hypothetical protein
MSGSLSLQSSRRMFGGTVHGLEELDMDMFSITISLCLLYLLTFDVDMGQRFACYACSSL